MLACFATSGYSGITREMRRGSLTLPPTLMGPSCRTSGAAGAAPLEETIPESAPEFAESSAGAASRDGACTDWSASFLCVETGCSASAPLMVPGARLEAGLGTILGPPPEESLPFTTMEGVSAGDWATIGTGCVAELCAGVTSAAEPSGTAAGV